MARPSVVFRESQEKGVEDRGICSAAYAHFDIVCYICGASATAFISRIAYDATALA